MNKTTGTKYVQPMIDIQAIKEYKARWEAVAEVEQAELRAMTQVERWQRLNLLFQFAKQLDKGKKSTTEEQGIIDVRERWNKLKIGYA